jgi:hypothetical protein
MIQRYMVNYHREEKIYDREEMRTWELTHLELSYKSKFPSLKFLHLTAF